MMKKLSTADRAASMTEGVSFHDVPMPRGLAFAINHVESHGAPVSIFSADRTVAAIAAHTPTCSSRTPGSRSRRSTLSRTATPSSQIVSPTVSAASR